MPKDLILGTAGHIDHGKTSLVKRLTGIDTDRLPEEKARGITIDIGFANLQLGEFKLGIVDVPGHERFVKNMLAGATGVDLAVLIVAADDGVMPQTREHLDILKLLGLRHGLIALTKADLVDDITRDVVMLELHEFVAGSFLEGQPIIATSAHTGLGFDELKQAIHVECEKIAAKSASSWFRLPIDRSFVVQGHGTVVTGTITSGGVHVGDELEWHKGDGTRELVRIRGLNNHGHPVSDVQRGQRGAINLAGVSNDEVRRGQELATPGYLKPSKVLTVRLLALTTTRKSIKHRLPCRLHIGTAEVMATVSILDADTVEPGTWVFAQLFLDDPVTAVWGQPFVIRDSSAERTLGGGQVLQPIGQKIRRKNIEQLEYVERLWNEDPSARTKAVAWFAGHAGFTPESLVRDAGVAPDEVQALAAGLIAEKTVIELLLPPHRKLLIHTGWLDELGERILGVLATLHEQNPLMTNHDRQKVLSRLDYVGDEALLQAVADRLIKLKLLVGDARRIGRADFKPKLSVNQRKLKDRIVEEHKKAGFQPPDPSIYINLAGGSAVALRDIFEVACAEGFLVRVTEELYLHADSDQLMRMNVTEKLKTVPGLTVAEIRDILGTTRKYAVPLCEFLDRTGLTRREGDLRVLVTASSLS
jgi:selenocysteine-specific elongation factor